MEGIHKIKRKYGHNIKKHEECGIEYKDCERYREYVNVKDDLIVYNFFCCNRNYQKEFNKDLKKEVVY